MKRKNLSSKLSLNKKTVANLEDSELISIKGGETHRTHCETMLKVCPSETPCNTYPKTDWDCLP
jgi:hypothetical protein